MTNKEIKKGENFYPAVNLGMFGDEANLSVSILNAKTGDDLTANATIATAVELIKPIVAHAGTTHGVTPAGVTNIAMITGNTIEAGDVVTIDGSIFRVTDATDTSITISEPTKSSFDSNTDIANVGNTGSYSVECSFDSAVGEVLVVISHPQKLDEMQRYTIVDETIEEKLDSSGGASLRMLPIS